MPTPKIFRVSIAGRVTPDVATAVGEIAQRDFKGKTSLAMENILRRGLKFDPSAYADGELKVMLVMLNGEMQIRSRASKPKSEVAGVPAEEEDAQKNGQAVTQPAHLDSGDKNGRSGTPKSQSSEIDEPPSLLTAASFS